jgi:hypothetical protein
MSAGSQPENDEQIVGMIKISSSVYPPVHHWLSRHDWRKPAAVAGVFVLASLVTGLWLLVLPPLLLVTVFIGASYASFELRFTNLALNVWDGGDFLEIERRGEMQRIPLEHFVDVTYRGTNNPPRALLTLRTPCRWGERLTFIPDLSGGRPRARKLVEQLNHRIQTARTA